MPGKLIEYNSDPNGKGRGSGLYYHRGNGYYSKYSEDIDKKIKASRHIKKKKKGLIGRGKYRHTHDLLEPNTKKKRSSKKKKKSKKSPRKGNGSWGGLKVDKGGFGKVRRYKGKTFKLATLHHGVSKKEAEKTARMNSKEGNSYRTVKMGNKYAVYVKKK